MAGENPFGRRERSSETTDAPVPFVERHTNAIRIGSLAAIAAVLAFFIWPEGENDNPADVSLVAASPQDKIGTTPTSFPAEMWIIADRAPRRTCPSVECGSTGNHFYRERAEVIEIKDGWARISNYRSTNCLQGESQDIDAGNKGCTIQNGFENGKFAEWIKAGELSTVRPADPSEGATGDMALVGGSDDFHRYGKNFAEIARKLINDGVCTEANFRENGTFFKSPSKPGPVYVLYCGDTRNPSRLYVNAETRAVFR